MKRILKVQHANGLWLRPREWAAVLPLVLAVLWLALPRWHARRLDVELPKDFRLSYKLRDDYLLYRSIAEKAVRTHPALFIGDSVVWGMYVRNDHALPAVLNAKRGGGEIANLAVDGLNVSQSTTNPACRHVRHLYRFRRILDDFFHLFFSTNKQNFLVSLSDFGNFRKNRVESLDGLL